jgi:hypothetical protein
LGFEGGDDNLYRYVFNNPVNQVDEMGLDIPPASIPTLRIREQDDPKVGVYGAVAWPTYWTITEGVNFDGVVIQTVKLSFDIKRANGGGAFFPSWLGNKVFKYAEAWQIDKGQPLAEPTGTPERKVWKYYRQDIPGLTNAFFEDNAEASNDWYSILRVDRSEKGDVINNIKTEGTFRFEGTATYYCNLTLKKLAGDPLYFKQFSIYSRFPIFISALRR